MMSSGYDYGPPTTVGDGSNQEDAGTPADTTGEVADAEGGDSPQDNSDATTVVDPGGSPSDDALAGVDPNIASLSPESGVLGTPATVTVTGSNFRMDSVVEMGGSPMVTTAVSETELTATLVDTGTEGFVDVTVRNPTSSLESNSAQFVWTPAGE